MSSRILVVVLAILLCLSFGTNSLFAADKKAATPSAIVIVELLCKEGSGMRQQIECSNSRIVISTDSIDTLIKFDLALIPTIMLILEEPEISFDLFARCYSIADQILVKNKQESVYWSGGCSTEKVLEHWARIVLPKTTRNEAEFRKRVFEDIKKKYKLAQKAK